MLPLKKIASGIAALIAAASPVSAQSLPKPDHIVVLIMENHAFGEIIGSSKAPHINDLCKKPNAAVFTHFQAIEHPSQPNYLDIFSGGDQGVTDDDVPRNYPFTTPNLAAELLKAGKTFVTYSEDLPRPGFDGRSSGSYARKHNPAANWVTAGDATPNQLPPAVNQPFTAFPADDLTKLPTVSFVVPNLDHDIHDGSIHEGDNWVYDHLSGLQQWALIHNTLFIITFDEDDYSDKNTIPVIFYGPMVKGGKYDGQFNHFSLLRTIEDIYGLSHAGKAADSQPITDCWQ